MRAAIPTDVLARLLSATDGELDAVRRVLGIKAVTGKQSAAVEERDAEPMSEEVARAAFAIVVKLDAEGKAPTPLTVFRLYCVDGLSAERVARKCGCGKATVIRRLQIIEARTGVKAEEFRAMSGHLQRIDDDLHASGAREIYRRGLANEEEEG